MNKKRAASQKNVRNLAETRSRVLQSGFLEFFKNGFHATSIDTIVENLGLTKGALFHQFPTKLALGYAVVNEVLIKMIQERWIQPLIDFEDPLEGILNQLRLNMSHPPQAQLNLGCPLNNLVQEMSNSDYKFQKYLSKALDIWIEGIDAHLKRGQLSGFIRKDIDTRHVATFIVTLHEGFFGMIKGKRDKSIYKSLELVLIQYFSLIRRN